LGILNFQFFKKLLSKRIALLLLAVNGILSSANSQPNAGTYAVLQKRLAYGWNTWSYGSMLTQVLLPEGLAMKVNFRNSSIGTPYDPNYFLEDITVDKSGMVRPIAHTFDGSYSELIIDNWYGNSIRIQSAAKGRDIVILVTPIVQSAHVYYDVELQTGMMWNREGNIQRVGEIISATIGTEQHIIRSTQKNIESFHAYTSPYFSVSGDTTVGFYTGNKMTVSEVVSIVANAKDDYNKYARKFGDKAEAFQGIESVLGWNTLYDAENNRVITPVTRGWNEAWRGYVLFEWDTYFAALLFSLDNKDLAYSAAISVTKLNKGGSVGFTQMPGGKMSEQSQPPVGSMVCWLLYEKFQEKWFLEEVYDKLLSWNRWWLTNRMNKGFLTWGAPWRNAKKLDVVLESGLDNSPMYEDIEVNSFGEKTLMNLADVGLNSLYTADCKYLSKIAGVLGRTKDENELLKRTKEFGALIDNLWDDQSGMYLNRFLDRPEFSYRLSPTLFYPMIAGVPSAEKASRMLKEHYYNPKEFYGTYIIPSISRNDKSFNNDYWRGAIWGPMNYLVYLGLKNYDKKAASELADKSYEMYSQAWKNHHYVFENINSVKGVSVEDNKLNADPYYHWGALMGLMKFTEEQGTQRR
jgi:putative isomerase